MKSEIKCNRLLYYYCPICNCTDETVYQGSDVGILHAGIEPAILSRCPLLLASLDSIRKTVKNLTIISLTYCSYGGFKLSGSSYPAALRAGDTFGPLLHAKFHPHFTPIGATCRPCGAKNLKIGL